MELFSERLLNWFLENGRDLPWRHTKDPYLIWVSEIILQQTRVAQGLDYYLRFIERFPNVKELASAKEDEVLKHWQGLGYYSRARNLHFAAKSIKGKFPSTYEDVLKLKGVGEYTAAAICSFAYDLPCAVVDGNVYRVLSRFFGIDTPIDTSAGKKEFKELAQELLDVNNPANYNQAIMDFGALQCTPKAPMCDSCPFLESCYAFNSNQIEHLPVKKSKVRIRHRYFNFFYIKQGPYTYIIKRTKSDIWKNLYQFPLIESDKSVDLADLLLLYSDNTLFKAMISPQFTLLVSDYKHILSHQHLHATFYAVTVDEETVLPKGYLKIKNTEIDDYAIPRLIHLFIEKYV